MTTQNDIAELSSLMQNTERQLRKTRRRASVLLRQIINRGDAAALTQMQQIANPDLCVCFQRCF